MKEIVWFTGIADQHTQTMILVVLIPPDYLRIRFICTASVYKSIVVGLIYAFGITLSLRSFLIYINHVRSIDS